MKKALLVVSFGTSYHDTCEKNIVACERDLAASCPDRDLFRAFTSGMIIRKLKQRDGIEIDTPLQALQKLAEQGYQDVAIQSLHIINGDEYEKIVREVQSMRPLFSRLTLGVPLLSSHEDYAQLMLALQQQMPTLRENEKVVFMGHGASHHKHIAQLSNMLCDGKILVQTFGDFQRGRRTTEERLCRNNLIPTLKDAVPGDLSLVFPHRIMVDIKEMLLALDKVTPGIASDETLLYGVEVKFYSNKVVVNSDFETSVTGLRAIGDGASVTRGLQQASANGISVARSILKKMES